MTAPLLRVRDLEVFYGAAQVPYHVSLDVSGGEIVAMVGPNGSGKSTLLRTIQGLHPPRRGEVWLDGIRIDGLPAHQVVARGVTCIPEGRRLFLGMTVRENLEVGAYLLPARQRMLALGRGLMTSPKILLLDDPFMGLAPRTIAWLCDTLRALSGREIGILIAGQHVRRILTLAGRAYLVEQGRITDHAPGPQLLSSPHLRRALLNTA